MGLNVNKRNFKKKTFEFDENVKKKNKTFEFDEE